MSDTTQGAERRNVAEVEGSIKFPDMHAMSEDKLAVLMYGISCNLLPLPWDPDNPLNATTGMLQPTILVMHHTSKTGTPQFVDGNAALEPVPGMVKMVLGVPYIYETYPEHAVIYQLVDELQLLTWGDKGQAPSTPAVYKLPEFKRNDRSSRPQEGSYEGSYNLASTVLKGQGQGTLILPLSISADEWDVLEYVMAENNVFTFGGGGVGPIQEELLKKPLVVLRDPGM
ncbi:hypothetical protein DFJ58DRAFT_845572 [Suillus subalutaceus]|uniref:uncharacterized protein n=1 Tax=Suillus subalutaceus TaxID=48586 RepID=UPI001B8717F5|nr:uncharacterized protein DFJ58DRAFT_845572 [Suillus subalutaceus]KAG1839813.1 hypothetical protein DFJ58DRAFT_845572 [Suillus subalutaceus]